MRNRQRAARSGVRNLAHFIDRNAGHGACLLELGFAAGCGFEWLDPLGPRAGDVSLTEPEIWRSRAGIPYPVVQGLAGRRANRIRASASNYSSTGDRRGDFQCDGGGPRRFGPYGAGCGGGDRAWRRGVQAFLRRCKLAGSAAVTARWKFRVIGGLVIAVVAAAIYFPILRRRVKRAARLQQQSEEQARRQLTQPIAINPRDPRVKTKLFLASDTNDSTLVPVTVHLPLSKDPLVRSKPLFHTLPASPADTPFL